MPLDFYETLAAAPEFSLASRWLLASGQYAFARVARVTVATRDTAKQGGARQSDERGGAASSATDPKDLLAGAAQPLIARFSPSHGVPAGPTAQVLAPLDAEPQPIDDSRHVGARTSARSSPHARGCDRGLNLAKLDPARPTGRIFT